MYMLVEYMKCVHIHITSLGLFPEISHVQLYIPGKMNMLKVTSSTLDAHVTLLCSQKHNNMESSTPVRLIANAQVLICSTLFQPLQSLLLANYGNLAGLHT